MICHFIFPSFPIRIGSCLRNGQQEDCQFAMQRDSDKYEINIPDSDVVKQVTMALDGTINDVCMGIVSALI